MRLSSLIQLPYTHLNLVDPNIFGSLERKLLAFLTRFIGIGKNVSFFYLAQLPHNTFLRLIELGLSTKLKKKKVVVFYKIKVCCLLLFF